MQFGYDFGDKCTEDKGKVINSWMTGDDECNAESKEYECGGIYNNNYMDTIGDRDHDCFWDCSGCKKEGILLLKKQFRVCEEYVSMMTVIYETFKENLPAYQEYMVLYHSLWDSSIITLASLSHRNTKGLDLSYLVEETDKEIKDLWEYRCKVVAHYDYNFIQVSQSKVQIIHVLEKLGKGLFGENYHFNLTQNALEFKKRLEKEN